MVDVSRRSLLLGALGTVGLAAAGCRSEAPASSATPATQPPTTGSAATGPSTTGPASTPSTTGGPPADPSNAWPPPDGPWPTVDPADAGWDAGRLEEAIAVAGEHATRSLVVLLGGGILAERHWGVDAAFRRDVASCQKSVTGLLVGIARDRGLLAAGDLVSDHLGAGWSDAPPTDEAQIRVEHLLTMSSGLDLELRRVAAPGTAWLYSNHAHHVLRLVLERVAGTGIDALSHGWLLDPIGAEEARWYQRPGAPDPKGRPLWGLRMTAREMARVGLLVQRGGTWDGTEVIRSGTLDEVLAPSQELNPAYGQLWWLNGQAPPYPIPGAPADLVAAYGKEDQKIYVSRSTDLVVARLGGAGGTGGPASRASFNSVLWTALTAAAPA